VEQLDLPGLGGEHYRVREALKGTYQLPAAVEEHDLRFARSFRDDGTRIVGPEQIASLHRPRDRKSGQSQHGRRHVEPACSLAVTAGGDASGRPHDQRDAERRLVEARVVEVDAVLAERLAMV